MKDIKLKFIRNNKKPNCMKCYFSDDTCKNECGDGGHFERVTDDSVDTPTEYEWKKYRLKNITGKGQEFLAECEKLSIWLKENKPEQWVRCTKENTNVGDEVRYQKSALTRKVDFIFDNGNNCVLTYFENGFQTNSLLSDYEININKDKE